MGLVGEKTKFTFFHRFYCPLRKLVFSSFFPATFFCRFFCPERAALLGVAWNALFTFFTRLLHAFHTPLLSRLAGGTAPAYMVRERLFIVFGTRKTIKQKNERVFVVSGPYKR